MYLSVDEVQDNEYFTDEHTVENAMRYANLSIERVRELLSYDRETGIFTWKIRPRHNSAVRAGDVAGSLRATGYRYISVDKTMCIATQLAWAYETGEWAPGQVGLKNGSRDDLRFDNLKIQYPASGKHDYTTPEGMKRYRKAHKEANPLVHRGYNWKNLYGLSAEDYQRMFAAQGGVCAVCKQPETAKSKWSGEVRWLSVDHNHATGAVRELLCYGCNSTLGQAKDNVATLEACAAYLRRHAAVKTKEPA